MSKLIVVRDQNKPLHAFVSGAYYGILGKTLITKVQNKNLLRDGVDVNSLSEAEHFTTETPIETLGDFLAQVTKIIAS